VPLRLHTEAVPVTSVRQATGDGASVEVHFNGAHVTSWRPAPGHEEWLFLSGLAKTNEGASIRGGIPVIFPQFAAEGPLPRHGFARTSRWTLEERGDPGVLAFTLRDSDETRAIWPASFLATLTVRIGGRALATTLDIENTGQEPFRFAAALHTYLRVDNVAEASIVGLHGGRYRVSTDLGELRVDADEVLHITGEMDRVYVDAPPRLTLREPRRELSIESTNFPDAVIWNPGAAKAAAFDDMEPGGVRHMLCVEAGAIQAPVTLEPGRRWTGTQTLIAAPRENEVDTHEPTGDNVHHFSQPPAGQVIPLEARDDLAGKLREVEAFIARAESNGEELPPEAAEVLARLREIVQALEGLSADLAE